MPQKRNKRLFDRIKTNTGNVYESASDKVLETRDKAQDLVRENPFKSIIIAAAVGAVVGVITSEAIKRMTKSKDQSLLDKLKRYFD